MPESTPIADKDYVGTLARGLSVIRVFGKRTPELTLTDVAKQAGLTRAAARRFLLTLCELGYMTTDGKYFRLTPKVMDLGFAYLSSMDLWEIAMPYMEEVSHTLNESCSASVLDDCDIVYVARVPASRVMSVGLTVGTRLPAFCTSMGRVLLADKPDDEIRNYVSKTELRRYTRHTILNPGALIDQILTARQRGFSIVDQELEEGLRSMAVPLRNKKGNVIAAMNVSGHAQRTSAGDMIQNFLPVLQSAARRIASALP
ncbi:MAG: IclR family transcriptional regulator [Azospirillaceae bacterium]